MARCAVIRRHAARCVLMVRYDTGRCEHRWQTTARADGKAVRDVSFDCDVRTASHEECCGDTIDGAVRICAKGNGSYTSFANTGLFAPLFITSMCVIKDDGQGWESRDRVLYGNKGSSNVSAH
eukprot:IDg12070t1